MPETDIRAYFYKSLFIFAKNCGFWKLLNLRYPVPPTLPYSYRSSVDAVCINKRTLWTPAHINNNSHYSIVVSQQDHCSLCLNCKYLCNPTIIYWMYFVLCTLIVVLVLFSQINATFLFSGWIFLQNFVILMIVLKNGLYSIHPYVNMKIN